MSIIPRIRASLAAVALPAVGMVLGHWVALHISLIPGASAESGDGVIRTQRLELVDAQGRSRIILGLSGEGSPAIWFLDQNGKSRLNLGTYGDGNPFIVLNDERQEAVQIFRTVDGMPVLVMKAEGRDRIILGLNGTREPHFEYFDAQGAKHTVFGN